MQNANVDSIPKRSRYAQGMIDLDLMDRGKEYNELNKSYLIYRCTFKLFKNAERHKYTFLNLCREDPQIELGDGAEKIYLCTKGNEDDVSESIRAFLQYIATGKPSDSFTDSLETAVANARIHKKWRQ